MSHFVLIVRKVLTCTYLCDPPPPPPPKKKDNIFELPDYGIDIVFYVPTNYMVSHTYPLLHGKAFFIFCFRNSPQKMFSTPAGSYFKQNCVCIVKRNVFYFSQ